MAKFARSTVIGATAWLYVAGALAQESPPTPQPSTSQGRYVIVFSPLARADTFLLDTQTGRVWQLTTYTDVVGEPRVWKNMARIDTEADLFNWLTTQEIKSDAPRKK